MPQAKSLRSSQAGPREPCHLRHLHTQGMKVPVCCGIDLANGKGRPSSGGLFALLALDPALAGFSVSVQN